MILAQIASKVDPGGIVGALDLTVPHAYLTRALILEASATTAETAAEVGIVLNISRFQKTKKIS
jgi:hypothetical protein